MSRWRTVWRFLKTLEIELSYDPEMPLLGIYLQKTLVQEDTCIPVFTATLFTTDSMESCQNESDIISNWLEFSVNKKSRIWQNCSVTL